MTDIVIDDTNFDQYFFDVRRHKPKEGQIMVCYSCMADFAKGPEKRQIIDLLGMQEKAYAITQVMRKLLFASELDAIRVPLAMGRDLLSGKTYSQVEKKRYRYKIEMFYYTYPQYLPQGDPHWTSISLINPHMQITGQLVEK